MAHPKREHEEAATVVYPPRLLRSDLPWLRRRLERALAAGYVCRASLIADEILRVEGILP